MPNRSDEPIYTLLDAATANGATTPAADVAQCLGYGRISVEAIITQDGETPVDLAGWKLQVAGSSTNLVWYDIPDVTSTANAVFHLPRGVYPLLRVVRGTGSGVLTVRLWRSSFTQE